MVFPIAGGTQDTGYEISNSLRFNDDDSAYLSRTPSSASNRKTWTWSSWIKRSNISLNMVLFSADDSTGHGIYLDTSDKLYLTKSGVGNYGIDAQLRDVSAWYHIVVAVDTTQTGMSNIVKFYINGVQRTASGTTLYSTNDDTNINNNSVHNIGRFSKNSSFYYDGYLSEVNFVDGSQLTPSSFGETNDNGVWIPKKYTGSYGTNGFYLQFKQTGTSANSSGMGADTSGNDHHFTPSNLAATDVTEDTPTNNFCTMNPLAIGADATLSEGNCQIAYGNGTRSVSTANMGFASGKWYWEWKISAASTDGCSAMPGIGALPFGPDLGTYLGTNSDGYSYNGEDGQKYNGGANSSYGNNFTTNDIISVAFDADNGNLYFYKNGTIQNSGTAAYTGLTSPSSGFYYPAIGDASGVKTFTAQANFGNAPFTISSGNADANGYGNFEYAVPSGYFALCTKNLAEFG